MSGQVAHAQQSGSNRKIGAIAPEPPARGLEHVSISRMDFWREARELRHSPNPARRKSKRDGLEHELEHELSREVMFLWPLPPLIPRLSVAGGSAGLGWGWGRPNIHHIIPTSTEPNPARQWLSSFQPDLAISCLAPNTRWLQHVPIYIDRVA